MAQLVLTAVGSLWGPVGAAIGSFIGAAIDGSLAPDPPAQIGPRLNELKVTGSTYGVAIPRHFGTVRKAGNITWSLDLNETSSSSSVMTDGKGDGPRQTTTTFAYFATFALSFGVGPARSVRRLWGNGVLMWDATTGASNPDAVALDFEFYRGTPDQLPDPTMEAALGVGMVPGYRDEVYIVFRDMPLEKFGNRIPSIEAELTMEGDWGAIDQHFLGITNATSWVCAVQAADGTVIAATINSPSEVGLAVFNPTTGEVITSSSFALSVSSIADVVYVPPTNEIWVPGGTGEGYERFNASTLAHVGSVANVDGFYHPGGAYYDANQQCVIGLSGLSLFFGYHLVKYELDGRVRESLGLTQAFEQLTGGGDMVAIGTVPSGRFAAVAINISAEGLGLDAGDSGSSHDLGFIPAGAFQWNSAAGRAAYEEGIAWWIHSVGVDQQMNASDRNYIQAQIDAADIAAGFGADHPSGYNYGQSGVADRRFHWLTTAGHAAYDAGIAWWIASVGIDQQMSEPDALYIEGLIDAADALADPGGPFIADTIVNGVAASFIEDTGAAGVAFDPSRNRYILAGDSIWTATDAIPCIVTEVNPSGYPPSGSIRSVRYVGGLDVIEIWTATARVMVLDADTLEVVYAANLSSGGYSVSRHGAFGTSQSLPGLRFMLGSQRPWTVDLFGTTYASVVRALCLASGELEPADIDTGEIGQRIHGYSVAQSGPVRSAIEQLARADFFDGVEEDDQLRFPRRGGGVVATITADECGAGIDQAAEHAITSTRQQEIDLPAKLFITAPDPFTDYQPGTQQAERLAHQAGEDETEQYAVVLTPDQGKRLADARLFDRWASREPGQISTTRKYARLTPGDPITLDGRRVRITSRSDEGGVIRFEWVTDDPDVVSQVGTGAQGPFTPQTVPARVPTTLIILDTSLLSDQEEGAGAYVAASGPAPNWRGTTLLASTDGGHSYRTELTLAAPGSAIGTATTALGDWTRGNRFDEANSLIVAMMSGQPSGTTRAAVLNGANGLAIEGPEGWEILQYRDATLNADGTYTLRGFLRGRRGTEWAIAGHVAGERVVLLGATTIRDMQLLTAELGDSRLYKAVTVGDTLNATAAQAFTVDGERLKPFAPVDLRALRDAATGDITFGWRRRSRLRHRFMAEGIAVPLGEDSEAYVVKVYDDNTYTTLLRTLAASTNSVAYSSAQQVADFGSNQSTVYVTVTQTSATVGAGHALQDAA